MEDWHKDGVLTVAVGQIVSEEVVDELKNCVPPAYLGRGLFQVGEPVDIDVETGKDLWNTYEATKEGWIYRGQCFLGKTENRIGRYQ